MSVPMVKKDYASWGEYRAELGKVLKASDHQGDQSWCGTKNVGQALAIADKGWPEGMDRVQSISIPAVNACTSALHEDGSWAWDVTGANYDVGEYLSGAPECWLANNTPQQKPVITIMANIVSSAGIPKEALEMRGAAVVALAIALQTSGYAVRVFAVEGMNVGGKDVWHRVNLTDDNGGPIDVDRILFGLAHPSAARQLGYCLGSVLAGASAATPNWIGWPSAGIKSLPPEEWKRDLYLEAPYMDAAEWQSAESVAAWVKATYDALSRGESSK